MKSPRTSRKNMAPLQIQSTQEDILEATEEKPLRPTTIEVTPTEDKVSTPAKMPKNDSLSSISSDVAETEVI